MSSIAEFAFVAAATGLVTSGMSWLMGRARPLIQSADSGTISPEFWSALVTVVGGVAMVGGGVFLCAGGAWPIGLLLAGIGVSIAGFMAPSLTTYHKVIWTRDYVEGPSRMFGLTLGAERTKIDWADIVNSGKTSSGYWYIETRDSRRIYWSFLYKGYRSFVSYLLIRCPNLHLPADVR